MDNKEYIENTRKTRPDDLGLIKTRFNQEDKIRLLHGAMGVITEGGELLDVMKKFLFYGKKIDVINIKEELGDILWYFSMIADTLGLTYEEIQEKNIEKLKARYGEKFNEKGALNRNLSTERTILEN